MYRNKKILAIVPARGGSKGIHLKNLRTINGISLVGHVGQCISKIYEIDESIVSTDNIEIARESEKFGLNVPFFRPDYLSGDRVSDYDVLVHCLEFYEKKRKEFFDIVLMLQPTSPLRTPELVGQCLKKCIDENWDSVWTVSRVDLKFHPLKQLKISEAGELNFFDEKGSNIIARQQLNETFIRNGAAYAFTRECLIDQKTIMGKKSSVIIDNKIHISIDTEEDLHIVEKLLMGNNIN